MMAAETDAVSISSTKLFADDAPIDRKVPIDSSNKLADKVPLQTPSIDELNERKMAATKSKINVDGSIVDDDDPSLDGEDVQYPIKDLQHFLHKTVNRSRIRRQLLVKCKPSPMA